MTALDVVTSALARGGELKVGVVGWGSVDLPIRPGRLVEGMQA